MKILVLNGSPRGTHSNTLQLTRAFCEGIAQSTSTELEILPVYRQNIQDCTGCFGCWRKTPGKCILKDDMAAILQKIWGADLMIWSFPLYYYGLPSRLKALMDRMLPTVLPFMAKGAESGGHPSRYDMSGKRYAIISTCGFFTAGTNYDAITAQFDHLYGKGGYTSLFCGMGELFHVPQLKECTDAYLDTVRTAGCEFAAGEITSATRDRLAQPLLPREVFEQMADASWGPQI